MMGENANSEKFGFAYVDDIIVYSKTEEEHAKRIADILRRKKEFGFRMNSEKSSPLATSLSITKIMMTPDK